MTQNKMLRAHWRERQRDLKNWGTEVLVTCGYSKHHNQRVRLEVDVYRHTRQDPDNAAGSLKHLLDALRGTGWLVDDNPDALDLYVQEHVERKENLRRTEVRLTLLEDTVS